MITLTLQLAVAAAVAAFAVLSLLIARQHRGVPEPHRSAWRVTAIVYLPYAVLQISQNTLAAVAYHVGEGHPLYRAYLVLAPVGNHSRTFVAFAFYAVLYLLARRGPFTPRGFRGVAWATAAGLLVGAAVGVGEGPLVAVRHYIDTAFADMAGFAVMGALLLYLMVRDTVDRDLWFSIALHGITSLFGVLYLTRVSVMGMQAPTQIWPLHAIRLFTMLLVAALAVHRYRMARRGRPVPGLLPDSRPATLLA
jgi:hypothetical protein